MHVRADVFGDTQLPCDVSHLQLWGTTVVVTLLRARHVGTRLQNRERAMLTMVKSRPANAHDESELCIEPLPRKIILQLAANANESKIFWSNNIFVYPFNSVSIFQKTQLIHI